MKTALIIAALAALNLLSFGLMAYDKRCARAGARRVPEKTLFLLPLLGGSVGAILGMNIFRHKTKHWYFRVFFPVLLVSQIVLLIAGACFLLHS